jgi:hypothetical protein
MLERRVIYRSSFSTIAQKLRAHTHLQGYPFLVEGQMGKTGALSKNALSKPTCIQEDKSFYFSLYQVYCHNSSPINNATLVLST